MKFIINKCKYCLLTLLLVFAGNLMIFGQDNTVNVTGRVYSAETGMPLGDIGIRAANDPVEPVNTNQDGEFEISLQNKNEQLIVSYPGYKDKTIFVEGREEIEIWLLGENDISVSNPTRMIFSEVPMKDIPAAIESGNLIEFNKSTNTSFYQDLQGMMSGLNVINRSGMPGEGAFMNTRGYSSLFSSLFDCRAGLLYKLKEGTNAKCKLKGGVR